MRANGNKVCTLHLLLLVLLNLIFWKNIKNFRISGASYLLVHYFLGVLKNIGIFEELNWTFRVESSEEIILSQNPWSMKLDLRLFTQRKICFGRAILERWNKRLKQQFFFRNFASSFLFNFYLGIKFLVILFYGVGRIL